MTSARRTETWRSLILGLLGFSMLIVGAELFLLEHTESRAQLVPFIMLCLGLLATAIVVLRPTRATLLAFRTVMLAFIITGLVGLYLHYKGNVEFEKEMYPELSGMKLFWEAIRGATPALSPGAMTQMGLLGLLFTFRHPRIAVQPDRAP